MKVKDHFLSGETFELQETEVKGIYKTFPIPQNIEKYYESKEYISHHQDSGSVKEKLYKFLQGFNLNFKRNVLAGQFGVNLKVLDYGCGAGEFVKFIENEYQTYGFEPNDSARNSAQQKTKKTKFISNLDEIENGSLDIITLWHVFEHIQNQSEMLNQFYEKLKPNAHLIIAVPNHTSYDGQKYKEFWAAYDVPRHVFHFSKTGMENFFNNQNWKLKKIKPLLLDSFYISVLSEKYKKSSFFWLKGFVFGSISNFKASKTGEFSSLVYIIEKK